MTKETLIPFNWEEAKKDPGRIRDYNGTVPVHIEFLFDNSIKITWLDNFSLKYKDHEIPLLLRLSKPKLPLAEAYAEWLDSNMGVVMEGLCGNNSNMKMFLQYFKDNVYNKHNK